MVVEVVVMVVEVVVKVVEVVVVVDAGGREEGTPRGHQRRSYTGKPGGLPLHQHTTHSIQNRGSCGNNIRHTFTIFAS